MKQINFVVECVLRSSEKFSDEDIKLDALYIVRLPNGQIVKMVESELALIDFFADSMYNLAGISEGK